MPHFMLCFDFTDLQQFIPQIPLNISLQNLFPTVQLELCQTISLKAVQVVSKVAQKCKLHEVLLISDVAPKDEQKF